MSKICPKCGRELQDESLFCVNCGQRMDAIEPLTFEPASNVPTEPVMPQAAQPVQPQTPPAQTPPPVQPQTPPPVHPPTPPPVQPQTPPPVQPQTPPPVQPQTPPPVQPQTPPPVQPQTPPPVQMQTPPPVQQAEELKKHSGLSIASLVLGIVGLVSCGAFMVPEVLAIVFGLVGIKDKKHKRGMAIAGTILGVVSIVAFIALIMYSIFEDPGFTPLGADTIGWLYIFPVAIAIGGIASLIISIMSKKGTAVTIISKIGGTVVSVAIAAFIVSIVSNNLVGATSAIRDAYPSSIPNITYGEAIDNFCGNVRWTTLKSEQETIYVQATGSCFYNGVEQDITIQFETTGIASNDSVKKGDPFRVSWIGFGEEKRTYDEMTEFLYTMFESYANKNGLDLEEYQKDGILMSQEYLDSQDQDDVDTNSDSSDDYDDGIDSNGFYEE